MKGLLLSLLASMSAPPNYSPDSAAPPLHASPHRALSVSDWQLSGQLSESCAAQASGAVTDIDGAVLGLQCVAAGLGRLSAKLAAPAWRHRRITISAELKSSDALHASLWLKTQRGATTLMFDDDSAQALLADASPADGWVRRSITLPVAADATQISFGVLVSGAGELAMREVKLSVSEPGVIAPEAAQLLNAAISIVKQQALLRTDLRWQVLEPQLRLFASGALRSADAYPAVQYLLSMLGDKQSLLLSPEVAAAFDKQTPWQLASLATTVNLFTLPDGARLVLSRAVADGANLSRLIKLD